MAENLIPDAAFPERERTRRPDDSNVAPPTANTAWPEADTDADAALAGRPAPIVQQWLDGERTEAEARRAEPRDAALWAQVNDETARRGRMTTPAPVLDRLMAAIPAAPEQDEGVVGKIKKLFGK